MRFGGLLLAGVVVAAGFAACLTELQSELGVGAQGGTVDKLHFAVVGAVLPQGAQEFPTALASRIWQGVEDETGHPHFAIATGDNVPAAGLPAATAQLEHYQQARARFHGPVFFAVGEQDSGPLYPAFARSLLLPSGQARPYYQVRLHARDRTWEAKLVVVAEESWDEAQAAWLRSTLAESTTYTFVVRHRPLDTHEGGPGTRASAEILAEAPYTLLIAGHEDRVRHDAAHRQLIVGNGSAPLGAAAQYGYVVARQRSDGAMVLTAYDYDTHATAQRFAVQPNGGAAALF